MGRVRKEWSRKMKRQELSRSRSHVGISPEAVEQFFRGTEHRREETRAQTSRGWAQMSLMKTSECHQFPPSQRPLMKGILGVKGAKCPRGNRLQRL